MSDIREGSRHSANGAVLDGYTKEIQAEGGSYSLSLLVRPETDLDSAFKAFDLTEMEWIRVRGWLFEIESVA